MKREFLKSLDLSEEQIDKIMAENGRDINQLKDKQTELESQITTYKQQISERDTQFEELKKSVGDSEKLKKQIEKLQEDNQKSAEEYESKIQNIRKDNAVTLALTNAGAKNIKAVRGLLDLESIEMDGDKLKGMEEQITKIKESDSYLFNDGNVQLKGLKPNEGKGASNPPKSPKDMTYEEFQSYLADGGTV